MGLSINRFQNSFSRPSAVHNISLFSLFGHSQNSRLLALASNMLEQSDTSNVRLPIESPPIAEDLQRRLQLRDPYASTESFMPKRKARL